MHSCQVMGRRPAIRAPYWAACPTPAGTVTDLHPTPVSVAAPSVRRRLHPRWWWVVATVALGALIGAGLGVWATPAGSSRDGASPTTTVGAGQPKPSVPGGLIGGGTAPARAATHTIDNRIFVVGDSVMQGAAPYLGDDLSGWSIIADTRVGRFLDEAIKVVDKRRDDIGQIVVLNLGNNYNGSEEQFGIEVNEMLNRLADVGHVIWINSGEFKDDRAEVNDTLRAATSSHANLTVVDWNSWWKDNRSFTGADHLHLSPEGAEAYAALIASAVTQVTNAAGEIPAPGANKPQLNTSGRIPSSSGSRSTRGSGQSRSRRRSTTSAPAVTVPEKDPTPTGPGSTTPRPPTSVAPATTRPTPTTPPPTSPPSPPTSAPG